MANYNYLDSIGLTWIFGKIKSMIPLSGSSDITGDIVPATDSTSLQFGRYNAPWNFGFINTLATKNGVQVRNALETDTAATRTTYGYGTITNKGVTLTLPEAEGTLALASQLPSVGNGTLTLQVGGATKTSFTANQSTNTTFNITASDLGLSSALKFLGVTTTSITDGATTNPITINGSSVTATTGNVVLYSSKEFVWDGTAWEELGDESSYVLKTTTYSSSSAGVALGGTANSPTITVTSGSVANGNTSVVTGGIVYTYVNTQLGSYIPLSGSSAITGSLIPTDTNSIDLGSTSKVYRGVYAHAFYSLSGGLSVGSGTNAPYTNYGISDIIGYNASGSATVTLTFGTTSGTLLVDNDFGAWTTTELTNLYNNA